MYLPHFVVKQKLTMMVNRYEISESDASGNPTRLLALAEQKRMAFKEQVTFFADGEQVPARASASRLAASSTSTPATTSPTRAAPRSASSARTSAPRCCARPSTSRARATPGTGQERSQLVGLLRRFTEVDFLPIHFDFVSARGTPLFSVERKMSIGDRYRVSVPDQRVDFRVAAAVAVGLDALMSR
jgi:uncharacterized protein YxjI